MITTWYQTCADINVFPSVCRWRNAQRRWMRCRRPSPRRPPLKAPKRRKEKRNKSANDRLPWATKSKRRMGCRTRRINKSPTRLPSTLTGPWAASVRSDSSGPFPNCKVKCLLISPYLQRKRQSSKRKKTMAIFCLFSSKVIRRHTCWSSLVRHFARWNQ